MELQVKAEHLGCARQRRRQTFDQIKGPEDDEARSNRGILATIINTDVEDIKSVKLIEAMADTGILERRPSVPYDDLIAKIVWELEDSPEAAKLTGVGAVEDLVALLEAACICEVQSVHDDRIIRLVLSSMNCLLRCLEALRLSTYGLLAANAHAHCAQAGGCLSPALRGLRRDTLKYVEALTMALFHKDRTKHSNWLLAFYSLCVQSHVRCALMSLEERLRSPELLSASSMEVEGWTWPLCSASYLQTAVFLFGHISTQGKGTLAGKILNSRPNPSVYLQRLHNPSPAGGSSRSMGWQRWREEGVTEFLGRIFQIPVDDCCTISSSHANTPASSIIESIWSRSSNSDTSMYYAASIDSRSTATLGDGNIAEGNVWP